MDPEQPGLFNRPDYFEVLAGLRRESPVHQYAPGAWVVSRYDDVRTVSRDPLRFCSGRGVLMNDPVRRGIELPGSILHMDPPEHRSWRKLVSRWLTPRAVAGLEDGVRAVAAEVLDEAPAGELIDLVDAVAAPLPVLVVAQLLGIGEGDSRDLRRWSDACIDGADEEDADLASVGELLAFLGGQVAVRRTAPGDDLLSALVASEVNGRRLTDDEVVMYCMSLLVAGNETARHLISGSVLALAQHPDQRARLAADPAALPAAVEECLRWVTPIQAFGRTATTDAELGGGRIEAGDWVVLLYASANRDEAVFGADAGRFDVGRSGANVAFGFGEHVCLGAHLARLEGRVFLEALLARYPRYEVAGEPEWVSSTLVRGAAELPVVLA